MVIDWTFNARENIRSIREYLKTEKVPQNTITEIIRDIIDAPEQLKKHPKLGRKVPKINREDFRELLHKKYRIVYLLPDEEPEKIYILNVIHGRQDIGPFLSDIWQRFLN